MFTPHHGDSRLASEATDAYYAAAGAVYQGHVKNDLLPQLRPAKPTDLAAWVEAQLAAGRIRTFLFYNSPMPDGASSRTMSLPESEMGYHF